MCDIEFSIFKKNLSSCANVKRRNINIKRILPLRIFFIDRSLRACKLSSFGRSLGGRYLIFCHTLSSLALFQKALTLFVTKLLAILIIKKTEVRPTIGVSLSIQNCLTLICPGMIIRCSIHDFIITSIFPSTLITRSSFFCLEFFHFCHGLGKFFSLLFRLSCLFLCFLASFFLIITITTAITIIVFGFFLFVFLLFVFFLLLLFAIIRRTIFIYLHFLHIIG
mmetsp:Transcript_2376/g.3244  ORF Transcript_2376/g.3244 Transcript_2376/m.3244 type:complete len:223 (+) Transcript_2376:1876-2544(+)